ncbi:MAG TPA: CBS domain-containing protein [Caulobacteraceae bacterium]|jgi:CBS domain-containing protein|nr:CBS domain-containing protein [Caulobacteraceae bacterium]
MLVSQIVREKGDIVFTVGPSETLAEAAALLHQRQVGAAVVVGAGGAVVGIISERDLVRQVALLGAEALARPVSAAMTRDVIYAHPDEGLDELLGRMTDRRVRHLPVMKEGRLAGLVSIGDLVKRKIAETEAEARELKAYIAA